MLMHGAYSLQVNTQ